MQNTMAPTDLLKIVCKVSILGHYGGLNGHMGHFGQINVHEMILFLHKKVHMHGPSIYNSTYSNLALIKGPVTWPQRGPGPWPVLCQQAQIQQFIRSNGTNKDKTKFNLSCSVQEVWLPLHNRCPDCGPGAHIGPEAHFEFCLFVMISKLTEPRYLCLRINAPMHSLFSL